MGECPNHIFSNSSAYIPRTCLQPRRGQDAAYVRKMAKLHHEAIGTWQEPAQLRGRYPLTLLSTCLSV